MTALPRIRHAGLGLALAVLGACGGSDRSGPTEPPGPTRFSLSGGWATIIHIQDDIGSRGDLVFCLTDASGVISGTGFVTDRQVALETFTVTGSYEPPHVLLTLDSPQNPLTIDATVEADPGRNDGAPHMVGALDGWVFEQAPVVIGWGPACPLPPAAMHR